jgi:hypothetical protein
LQCNNNESHFCYNNYEFKCKPICPIDCVEEDISVLSNSIPKQEYNGVNDYYVFWDSMEVFVSYEETADMLLLDYFTYIGGLFGLWFGISLENLIDIIVKNTIIVRSQMKNRIRNLLLFVENSIDLIKTHAKILTLKLKLNVKTFLSFIYILFISFVFWTYDLIVILFNYTLNAIFLIREKIELFSEWFGDLLKNIIDLTKTNAKNFISFLKFYVNTILSFILIAIQLIFNFIHSLIKCIFNIILKIFLSSKNRITNTRAFN